MFFTFSDFFCIFAAINQLTQESDNRTRNKLLFNHGINLLPYTGAGSGITRALKFTPDIKFENDEALKEFVVTVVRGNMGGHDRDSDRDDRAKGDREDKDNNLTDSDLNGEGLSKTDRVEDREDRVVSEGIERVSYRTLSKTQKNVIQFCSVPRTAKVILEHIGYSYNSTNMSNQVKTLISMGFLEMTEPKKPNSKNQKYRKVIFKK